MPLHPLLCVLLALLLGGVPAHAGEPVTVFAAASLKTALDEVSTAWEHETQNKARLSYAASSALAKQIEQGAPADVFFSADLAWMDYLAEREMVDTATVTKLLGNDIVLIAPKDSTLAEGMSPADALAKLPEGARLAMADVKAVPAGKYGKASLKTLGLWPTLEHRIAQAENVRAALKLVAAGEAPLGIVYRTDVEAEPAVKIVAELPAETHPPIIYPVALVSPARSAAAANYLDYIKSPTATAIFKAHGFKLLDGSE